MNFMLFYLFFASTFLSTLQNDVDTVIIENKIVNLHIFNYTLNPGDLACKQQNIFLLVYVHSAPANYKRRITIRETWTNMFREIRVVFMLGDTPDKVLKNLLSFENSLYGDLVQENFIDSYRNLTHKGIMALKWTSEYCSNVKYFLKVDDDVIVDIFKFWRHLKKLDEYKMIEGKTILCNIWTKMKVLRDNTSKWYLSKKEFNANFFGKYCSGSAFLLTKDLARDMYNVSKYVNFFWVDDYYISGSLARAANASYYKFNQYYAIQSANVEQKFKLSKPVFGHVSKKMKKFDLIWYQIYNEQLKLISKLPFELKTELKEFIGKEFWWSREVFTRI